MSAQRNPRPPVELKLPVIDQRRLPLAAVVRRSVTISLAVVGLVIVVVLSVVAFVSIDVTTDGTGILQPVTVAPVRALEGGIITSVLVQTGDTVVAGQVLARFDSLDLSDQATQLRRQLGAIQIDVAKASSSLPLEIRRQGYLVAQASARLVTARAGLATRLLEYGMGSNVDSMLTAYRPGTRVGLDQAVAEVRGAQASQSMARDDSATAELKSYDIHRGQGETARLRAAIATVEEKLRRLDLRAPTSGIVLTEDPRRLLSAQERPGDVVLELADPSKWQAEIYLDERSIHEVHVGDSVRVELPAMDRLDIGQLAGRVKSVAVEQGAPPMTGASASTAIPTGYRVTVGLDAGQLDRIGMSHFRRGYSVQARVLTRHDRIINLIVDYFRDHMHRLTRN